MIAHELMHSHKSRKRVSQTYMAVKTNITKAYDRVDWNFLEGTLRAFGFAEKWITWVMALVSTIEYSVLINGVPQGHIIPRRGLRQGDPISSYLYILCADILSHLIDVQVRRKKINGIKIGQGTPYVTHIFFADDSLFFCIANQNNCKALKEVFDIYEKCSGQKINQDKSVITFGSKVHGSKQDSLKHILGISNHGGDGKYLGLPEQFGWKKKEMFSTVVQRVKQRTSHWSTKFLSPAGKEVMIKSVAVSTPIYSMSHFKLPVATTQEIDAILMRFWWGKNDLKGLPWVAWKKLQS